MWSPAHSLRNFAGVSLLYCSGWVELPTAGSWFKLADLFVPSEPDSCRETIMFGENKASDDTSGAVLKT